MPDRFGDLGDLKAHARFLSEVEQDIRTANTQIIHERIPALSREAIHAFAVAVGRLRARYLEAAFKLGVDEHGDPPDEQQVNELRRRREMFEEARSAFDALQHAIGRGYIDVEGLHGKTASDTTDKKK